MRANRHRALEKHHRAPPMRIPRASPLFLSRNNYRYFHRSRVKTRIYTETTDFILSSLREKPFIRLWETKLLPPGIIEFSTIYYRTTNKRITTLLSHVRSRSIGKSIETDFSLRWTEKFSIIPRSILLNSDSLISKTNARWLITRNLANSYYPKMMIQLSDCPIFHFYRDSSNRNFQREKYFSLSTLRLVSEFWRDSNIETSSSAQFVSSRLSTVSVHPSGCD